MCYWFSEFFYSKFDLLVIIWVRPLSHDAALTVVGSTGFFGMHLRILTQVHYLSMLQFHPLLVLGLTQLAHFLSSRSTSFTVPDMASLRVLQVFVGDLDGVFSYVRQYLVACILGRPETRSVCECWFLRWE